MSALILDPKSIPVEGIAGETAIPDERLTREWLRQRFARPPHWVAEDREDTLLQGLVKSPIPASVLIPIVMRESGLTLLFTQRTNHLHDHAGQVSLPGGRVDAEDESAVETALRETEEEVGLHRRHLDVLGALPDYVTGTGFCVTPVVALATPPFDLRPDPFEVAEIFEVPMAFLMNGCNHERRSIDLPGGAGRRTFYAMPYQHHFIWGATAGMLRNLFHFLRA